MVAEPSTTANETSVVNNKKSADELVKILSKAESLQGIETIAAYILFEFVKLVAKNYGKYFKAPEITKLTSIGVNFEYRYLTTFDADGNPVSSVRDNGNYDLPEMVEAFDKMTGESDDDADGFYDSISDFLYCVHSCDEDNVIRESFLEYFEHFLAEAWDYDEIKLTLEFGYLKIEVKH